MNINTRAITDLLLPDAHVNRIKDGVHFVTGETQGENGTNYYIVYSGNEKMFLTQLRSSEDIIDEVYNHNNECAEIIGKFTTRKNNLFILWWDYEIGEHYITKI